MRLSTGTRVTICPKRLPGSGSPAFDGGEDMSVLSQKHGGIQSAFRVTVSVLSQSGSKARGPLNGQPSSSTSPQSWWGKGVEIEGYTPCTRACPRNGTCHCSSYIIAQLGHAATSNHRTMEIPCSPVPNEKRSLVSIYSATPLGPLHPAQNRCSININWIKEAKAVVAPQGLTESH